MENTMQSTLERLLTDKVMTFKGVEYPLRQITAEEVLLQRISGVPGFVLKMQHQFWFTEVPQNSKLIVEKWLKHQCTSGNRLCSRFKTLSEREGGCSVISDGSFNYYMEGGSSLEDAYLYSMRIEKYAKLEIACETFNCIDNSIKVLKCNQYAIQAKSKEPSKEKARQAFVGITQQFYPDVQNLQQMEEKTDSIRVDIRNTPTRRESRRRRRGRNKV